MNETQIALLELSSVTVYHKLLQKPVFQKYLRLLESANGVELRGFLHAYADFFSALCEAEPAADLGAYLLGSILADDNVFARSAARGAAAASLTAAAQQDIEHLARAVRLGAARIKHEAAECFRDEGETGGLIARLPEWAVTTACGQSPAFDLREPQGAAVKLADYHAAHGHGRFAAYGAFVWRRGIGGQGELCGVQTPDPITLGDLKGYESERRTVVDNTLAFLNGYPANNLLLYGDRGTGKSSTVKAVFNACRDRGLRIIEISKDCIVDFARISALIQGSPLKFILFIDDLSFSRDDGNYAALKGVLEGGLAARPGNAVIYATSNRRHFVRESFSERENDVHAADTMQEKLSLADRFGITVTFSAPDQALYFEIVTALAADRGLQLPPEALRRGAAQWALTYNGRSPRAARQYVDWLEGRVRQGLPYEEI